ncbi:putative phospholipid methyltransferase [Helianthus annuus]|nr:putative phospholipid methyltransferase [Helianthus annuus]
MVSPIVVSLGANPSLLSPKISKISLRHFNKHLVGNLSTRNTFQTTPHPPLSIATNLHPSRPHFVQPIRSSYSSTVLNNFDNFSIDALKKSLVDLNPIRVLKWVILGSFAVGFLKWGVSTLLSPFFWMYFSWTWVFWPWYIAIGLAIYGVYGFSKHIKGEASVTEQLAIVTSVFTWLTLVPPGYANGFLEGWPFVFFFVYHYFFFLNVSIRKRLYGDYYLREHDPKWDVTTPVWHRVLFCVGVTVGHWFAAFEAPQLHLVSGGWRNLGIWGLIMSTVFLQYYSTLYLAKYSEKVVVPTAVVQFGPYRWVRHPIYASTGLLFLSYFIALQAPLSSLFIIAVCLMYYDQKAKLEEGLMVDTFGNGYTEYMEKVRYKFIPFVY